MPVSTHRIATGFLTGVLIALMLTACSDRKPAGTDDGTTAATDIEAQVQEYLRLFPYQETYRYAMLQTGGDPARLNTWATASRNLLRAGEDAVVRSNNDTLQQRHPLQDGVDLPG